jgi:phytoene synthase
VYLPQQDCARFGVTDEMIRAGALTEPVRNLLAYECRRARQFFDAAGQALPADGVRRLVAAEIMGGIYADILRRIERRGYDVFSSVVRVPRPVRARIALSIWVRARLSALSHES